MQVYTDWLLVISLVLMSEQSRSAYMVTLHWYLYGLNPHMNSLLVAPTRSPMDQINSKEILRTTTAQWVIICYNYFTDLGFLGIDWSPRYSSLSNALGSFRGITPFLSTLTATKFWYGQSLIMIADMQNDCCNELILQKLCIHDDIETHYIYYLFIDRYTYKL